MGFGEARDHFGINDHSITDDYVWNKITVDRIAVEVNAAQAQYQKITNANDLLRAEINKKSNLERIGKIAAQLGLTYPKEQPASFPVDGVKLESLETE